MKGSDDWRGFLLRHHSPLRVRRKLRAVARSVTGSAILVLAARALVAAQQPRAAADSGRSVLMQAEKSKWIVRATLLQGGSFQGRGRFVSDTAVVLDSHRFDPAQLSVLERRMADKRYTERGALVGGVAGFAFGVLTMAPFAELGEDQKPSAAETVRVAGELALLGALVGAAVGGVLSLDHDVWTAIWRR